MPAYEADLFIKELSALLEQEKKEAILIPFFNVAKEVGNQSLHISENKVTHAR